MRSVRVVLCQIEAHPALYTSHIAYLEEPFVPPHNGPSLSLLASKGVNVEGLQALCLREYRTWASQRLEQILGDLSKIEPAPDIIVFPEGSIPLDSLESASAFSLDRRSNIFAGTHTPLRNSEAKQIYDKVGVGAGRVKKLVERG